MTFVYSTGQLMPKVRLSSNKPFDQTPDHARSICPTSLAGAAQFGVMPSGSSTGWLR
jgi:hypothetical protein